MFCTYCQYILSTLFQSVLESNPLWVRMPRCRLCSRRPLVTKQKVCVTFGARWCNTYFCRCRGCSPIHVSPPVWERRPWRYGLQCGLVHTQQRRCQDFAMWTLNGGAFGCHVCPLLLIHGAPVAPLVVACVLPLRLPGDLVFDLRCSRLVCVVVCALVGEQRRARREVRIQMDEGVWAEGICSCRSASPAQVCAMYMKRLVVVLVTVGAKNTSGSGNINTNEYH